MFNDKLFQRLLLAKRPDLEALLKDLKVNSNEFRDATDDELVKKISAELRLAASWSLDNIGRPPHDFSYKKILIDVADKLAPGLGWTKFKLIGPESEDEIEDYIYERFLILMEKHLKSMNVADKAKLQKNVENALRKQGLPEQVVQATLTSLATGTLTGVIVGPIIASAIFGGFWTWLFGLSLGQLILGGVAGGGPVGLLIAFSIFAAGPSYTKTIPAVSRLILIRLSHEVQAKL
jgi:uncharacterized protein YaaW (UPF0174 family)